jgi:hypothetical protein
MIQESTQDENVFVSPKRKRIMSPTCNGMNIRDNMDGGTHIPKHRDFCRNKGGNNDGDDDIFFSGSKPSTVADTDNNVLTGRFTDNLSKTQYMGSLYQGENPPFNDQETELNEFAVRFGSVRKGNIFGGHDNSFSMTGGFTDGGNEADCEEDGRNSFRNRTNRSQSLTEDALRGLRHSFSSSRKGSSKGLAPTALDCTPAGARCCPEAAADAGAESDFSCVAGRMSTLSVGKRPHNLGPPLFQRLAAASSAAASGASMGMGVGSSPGGGLSSSHNSLNSSFTMSPTAASSRRHLLDPQPMSHEGRGGELVEEASLGLGLGLGLGLEEDSARADELARQSPPPVNSGMRGGSSKLLLQHIGGLSASATSSPAAEAKHLLRQRRLSMPEATANNTSSISNNSKSNSTTASVDRTRHLDSSHGSCAGTGTGTGTGTGFGTGGVGTGLGDTALLNHSHTYVGGYRTSSAAKGPKGLGSTGHVDLLYAGVGTPFQNQGLERQVQSPGGRTGSFNEGERRRAQQVLGKHGNSRNDDEEEEEEVEHWSRNSISISFPSPVLPSSGVFSFASAPRPTPVLASPAPAAAPAPAPTTTATGDTTVHRPSQLLPGRAGQTDFSPAGTATTFAAAAAAAHKHSYSKGTPGRAGAAPAGATMAGYLLGGNSNSCSSASHDATGSPIVFRCGSGTVGSAVKRVAPETPGRAAGNAKYQQSQPHQQQQQQHREHEAAMGDLGTPVTEVGSPAVLDDLDDLVDVDVEEGEDDESSSSNSDAAPYHQYDGDVETLRDGTRARLSYQKPSYSPHKNNNANCSNTSRSHNDTTNAALHSSSSSSSGDLKQVKQQQKFAASNDEPRIKNRPHKRIDLSIGSQEVSGPRRRHSHSHSHSCSSRSRGGGGGGLFAEAGAEDDEGEDGDEQHNYHLFAQDYVLASPHPMQMDLGSSNSLGHSNGNSHSARDLRALQRDGKSALSSPSVSGGEGVRRAVYSDGDPEEDDPCDLSGRFAASSMPLAASASTSTSAFVSAAPSRRGSAGAGAIGGARSKSLDTSSVISSNNQSMNSNSGITAADTSSENLDGLSKSVLSLSSNNLSSTVMDLNSECNSSTGGATGTGACRGSSAAAPGSASHVLLNTSGSHSSSFRPLPDQSAFDGGASASGMSLDVSRSSFGVSAHNNSNNSSNHNLHDHILASPGSHRKRKPLSSSSPAAAVAGASAGGGGGAAASSAAAVLLDWNQLAPASSSSAAHGPVSPPVEHSAFKHNHHHHHHHITAVPISFSSSCPSTASTVAAPGAAMTPSPDTVGAEYLGAASCCTVGDGYGDEHTHEEHGYGIAMPDDSEGNSRESRCSGCSPFSGGGGGGGGGSDFVPHNIWRLGSGSGSGSGSNLNFMSSSNSEKGNNSSSGGGGILHGNFGSGTNSGKDYSSSRFSLPARPALVRQSSLLDTKLLLSTQSEDIAPSRRPVSFREDFEEEGLLGSGTFADVYRVRQITPGVNNDVFYALKKSKRQFRSKRDRDWLMAEVRTMKLLGERGTCNYVVPFVRAWQEESYFYVQMGYAERGTLKDLLLHIAYIASTTSTTSFSAAPTPMTRRTSINQGLVPDNMVWHVVHDVASGLQHIHRCGMVHLDIKPANLLITEDGIVQIGDFGMAAPIGSSDDGNEGDTRYVLRCFLCMRIYG